jgi:large subunit ribosomal protein L4
MLKGGGVAFGPKPRDFSTGLQKKVYDLAWRTALSYRFRKGELVIVDNPLEIESPSALLLGSVFNQLRWGGKNGSSLLVTLQDRPLLSRALSTTSKLGRQLTWDEVDVKNILEGARVVIERKALKNILLTHQDDLVRSTHPPKLVQQSEPTELINTLGWPEFASLETAPPEEQEELKPLLFERLAEEKFEQASKLPPAESTPLKISAYELLHESLDLKSKIPQQHPDFSLHESENESERAQGLQHVIEYYTLQAESSQYKAESLRLQGLDQAAEDWESDADAQRGEADERQAELDEILGIERSVEEEALDTEVRRS